MNSVHHRIQLKPSRIRSKLNIRLNNCLLAIDVQSPVDQCVKMMNLEILVLYN